MATPFLKVNADQVAQVVSSLLAPGSGIQILQTSVQLKLSGLSAVSLYDGSLAALGIGPGLLLTSGIAPGLVNAVGWFGEDNAAQSAVFENGDPDINTVVNTVFQTLSYDATTLSLDFVVTESTASSVSFDLVFGSEEYPEWVDQFVDCAVVLVNGVNVALFSNNPMHPLSVVSGNLAAGYFQDNTGALMPIEYDGVSKVLKIVAPIIGGGVVNHLKIGIADTGDHIYDSGLFLSGLVAGQIPGVGVVAPSGKPGSIGDDILDGTAEDEYFSLEAGNDKVYAGPGNDIIVGGSGADELYCGSGDDQVKGDAGDDTIDGGLGVDTAVFSASRSGYLVTGDSAGLIFVSDLAGGEGTDTLRFVERLKFADGTFEWTTAGTLQAWSEPSQADVSHDSSVVLAGLALSGHELIATAIDADGILGVVAWQWQRSIDGGHSWLSVDGEQRQAGTWSSYIVQSSDQGCHIRAVTQFLDAKGHAEEAASAARAVQGPDDGDFTITLIELAAPSGAAYMNPLTTLLMALVQAGASPNLAAQSVKGVLDLPVSADLAKHDGWFGVQAATPGTVVFAEALVLEKRSMQIAVLASLSGDQTCQAIANAVLYAAGQKSVLDLTARQDVGSILGLDEHDLLVREIAGRCGDIEEAKDLASMEAIWADIQSGLDVVLSPSLADLSVHLNRPPAGLPQGALTFKHSSQAYLLDLASLLDGFSDPDGDALVVVPTSLQVDQGALTVSDQSLVLQLPSGFTGPVEIAYAVSDGQGGSVQAVKMLLVSPPAALRSLDLQVFEWRHQVAMPNITVLVKEAGVGTADLTEAVSDTNGRVLIGGLPESASSLVLSAMASPETQAAAGKAVDLQDAIEILRLIVGLDEEFSSGGPSAVAKARAADFDADGSVSLSDAIGVLRHVVGLDAPKPQWLFLHQASASAQVGSDPLQLGEMPVLQLDQGSSLLHLSLIGVLSGDVDGSFVPPPGP